MVIQHNIPAINAHRYLGVNNAATSKNLEKLSSGFRINRAGDDAAGLAISEKMRGQIRGLGKAEENTSNAINLIQTAEGGMQELHSIVQRMKEIAVQSTNGTYQNAVDRTNLDLEFQELKEEFNRITDYTNYNGIKLLDGDPFGDASTDELLFQVGANGTQDQQVTLTIRNMHASQLGETVAADWTDVQATTFTNVDATGALDPTSTVTVLTTLRVDNLNVLNKDNANISIVVLEAALNDVSEARAELGAKQNRLEYTLNNLGVTKENLTAAESTIRDVDMAKEMMEFTKNSILVQSAQAMLAQANSLPQGVLQLLR